MAGDGVHDVLDGQHALGAAEAAVGGVGRQVGLASVAGDLGIAEKVGVVGMEHGAVDDGVGQVRRIAAVACQFEADAQQPAVVVEADVVLDMEGMALAGHVHVFEPRQAHLHRAPGEMGEHRAERRRHAGLALLAAEATAHASHVDGDPVHGDAEHLGHLFLHLGGILGRRIDQHAAVFGGHDRGHLGFQVEVLLAADGQFALQTMGGSGQGGGRVTQVVAVAGRDEVLAAQRFLDVEDGLQRLVFDEGGLGGAAGSVKAGSGHRQYRLAQVLHLAIGEQRIAGEDGANVQLARYVGGGDGQGHAGNRVAGREIDVLDPRMGVLAHARIDVQLVGEFQAIVDIQGLATDMLVGALVLERLADTAGQAGGEGRGHFLGGANGEGARHGR